MYVSEWDVGDEENDRISMFVLGHAMRFHSHCCGFSCFPLCVPGAF